MPRHDRLRRAGDVKMEIDKGVAVTDGDSWLRTLSIRIGIAMSSLVNEFIATIQFVLAPTQATASYEKCGLIVQGVNRDSSDYTKNPAITKDGVAVSGSCRIESTKTGRAWGLYGEATAADGADGMLVGLELGLNNFGSDQPNLDTPTSKIVLSLVAGEGGTKPITAFMEMDAGSAAAHSGLIANRTAFVDQDNAVAYAVRDSDGHFSAGLTAAGKIFGAKFAPPYILQDTAPNVDPGCAAIWGDTKTGIVYIVFNGGGGCACIPFQPMPEA